MRILLEKQNTMLLAGHEHASFLFLVSLIFSRNSKHSNGSELVME